MICPPGRQGSGPSERFVILEERSPDNLIGVLHVDQASDDVLPSQNDPGIDPHRIETFPPKDDADRLIDDPVDDFFPNVQFTIVGHGFSIGRHFPPRRVKAPAGCEAGLRQGALESIDVVDFQALEIRRHFDDAIDVANADLG